MKLIKVICLSVFFCFNLFGTVISASQIAVTNDGKKVELHEDGTYSFVKENESNTYKRTDFADFMIDSKEMVGSKIIIKGAVGFFNNSGEKYPIGKIYQKFSTLGPAIPVHTSNLSREDLKKIHKNCALDCNIKISGEVKTGKYNRQFIEAESIKLVDHL